MAGEIEKPENYAGHPLYTLENCTSCKACVRACKPKAIEMDVEIMPDGRKMLKSYILDFEKCNFCGKCAEKCPNDTIIMVDDFEGMVERVDKRVFSISEFMELKNELKLRDFKRAAFIIPENCIACELCVMTCPVKAIIAARENGRVTITVKPDLCGGCGECVRNCPAYALGLVDVEGIDVAAKQVFTYSVDLPEKVLDDNYFGNLKAKVIDSGLCSHCGTCTTICPVYGIIAGDKPIEFPNYEENCIDCGSCVRVCPRWNYKPLSGVGEFIELTAARSKRFVGQDGGMVSEIIASALEMGLIESSLFVDRDEEWKTKIVTIRKPKQLENSTATGTKYSFADVMPEMRRAVFRAKKGLGFVGTPCMVSGLRKIQGEVESFRAKVKIAVALFCTENFYYHQLAEFLAEKGVDLKEAVKTDITKGKFIVTLENGEEVSFSVKELESIVPSGCRFCIDFSGVESDLSVGSVGSKAGYSTIIVRTEIGKKIIDYIKEKDYAEFIEADLGIVEKLSNYKVKKNLKYVESLNK